MFPRRGCPAMRPLCSPGVVENVSEPRRRRTGAVAVKGRRRSHPRVSLGPDSTTGDESAMCRGIWRYLGTGVGQARREI